MSDPQTDELTPREQVEATVWRILRSSYVRLICTYTGKTPMGLTDEEVETILEPHLRRLDHDATMIMSCVDQGTAIGASITRQKLHALHVDQLDAHALLEELEYETPPEDAPWMAPKI